MNKLLKILGVIAFFVAMACGGVYLNTKVIRYIAGPSCNCLK